ncbi:preprotein translocase subunit YajC [Desulfococcaceae bacterium HSG8]|nr:preprotein translocase subunit YajC [Desulfococcaceae bacterium HSG8]
MLISIAYAMGQGGAAGQGAQGGFGAFVPLILMFVIFYFLLIRPQQKKQKEHQEMLRNLKKGDRVMTNGGIHGRITSIDEVTLTLEIADKIRIKVNRSYIAALLTQSQSPKEDKSDSQEIKSK